MIYIVGTSTGDWPKVFSNYEEARKQAVKDTYNLDDSEHMTLSSVDDNLMTVTKHENIYWDDVSEEAIALAELDNA